MNEEFKKIIEQWQEVNAIIQKLGRRTKKEIKKD